MQRLDRSELESARKIYGGMPSMIVTDQDSSEFAQGFLTKIKAKIKSLNDARLERTRPLDALKALLKADYDEPIKFLELAAQDANKKIIAYHDEQLRIQRETQRKLDEEAEAQRQRDLKLAEKAEKRGDIERAGEFIDRAETRVAPVVQAQSAAVGKRAFVETFDYEMLDESKLAREFLMPDHNKIGRTVRSLHKDAEALVGKDAIKVTSSKSVRG